MKRIFSGDEMILAVITAWVTGRVDAAIELGHARDVVVSNMRQIWPDSDMRLSMQEVLGCDLMRVDEIAEKVFVSQGV